MVDLELSWQAAAVTAGVPGRRRGGLPPGQPATAPPAAGFVQEAAVLLALFALWQLAGSYALLGPGGAIDRAQWIWHAERAVHLPSEAGLQQAFLSHPLVVQALNLYYAGLHFAVVIGCLLWVYIWHRRQYPQVRTTLVLFTAGALLIQLVPVAPPRMLPGDNMIDTAVQYGQSVYGSVAGFNADQLSAMPSVHVGWALLVAAGGGAGVQQPVALAGARLPGRSPCSPWWSPRTTSGWTASRPRCCSRWPWCVQRAGRIVRHRLRRPVAGPQPSSAGLAARTARGSPRVPAARP